MKKSLALLSILSLCTLVACRDKVVQSETPQEGASAILALVQNQNYAELFQTRYAEWHKVEAEGMQPDEAIRRLTEQWKRNEERIFGLYEQLKGAEFTLGTNDAPQPGETGEFATAMVKIGDNVVPFKLYRMESGLWGFHQ